MNKLDENQQVDFKGKAKAFVRTYTFLASILPYSNPDWEKLSIFLNFLIPKLPAPEEPDLARGILEAIDMDTYRAEKRSTMKLILEDSDAEIEPVPTTGGGRLPESEMDYLSNIVRSSTTDLADCLTTRRRWRRSLRTSCRRRFCRTKPMPTR